MALGKEVSPFDGRQWRPPEMLTRLQRPQQAAPISGSDSLFELLLRSTICRSLVRDLHRGSGSEGFGSGFWDARQFLERASSKSYILTHSHTHTHASTHMPRRTHTHTHTCKLIDQWLEALCNAAVNHHVPACCLNGSLYAQPD